MPAFASVGYLPSCAFRRLYYTGKSYTPKDIATHTIKSFYTMICIEVYEGTQLTLIQRQNLALSDITHYLQG